MLVGAAIGMLLATAQGATPVSVSVDTSEVLNPVDERVYGHFYEHIYHSANGGLWGEQVWNRSFESLAGDASLWTRDGETVCQLATGPGAILPVGDPAWTDYEFSLEARKTGGLEGFLIVFRYAGPEDYYWYNLGGWGNAWHGLERGVPGGARAGVGERVPGTIETDHWYRIRVRCEGNRARLWVDDALVLDRTDPENSNPAGAAGLATWFTTAAFRELKVTRLDGEVLFSGLPEVKEEPAVPRDWSVVGEGLCRRSPEDALNNDFCMYLKAEAAGLGLQQTPMRLRAEEHYDGSIWVRGRAREGLSVGLYDGEACVASTKLAAPEGDGWSERAFTLTGDRDVDDGTLRVTLNGSGEVWLDQVSMMPRSVREAGGFRPDLLEAMAGLRPPVIRWPGGCYAERYRWPDGIGPQHERGKFPIALWDDEDVNSLGTDEFIALCRKLGSEPLIVINTGRHDPGTSRASYIEEACAWIEYCNGPATSRWGKVRAENGHPEPYGVKLWEIDNETWPATAEGYVEIVKAFAPAMKAAYPSITLLACGSAGYGEEGIGLPWNKALIEGCGELFDYLSIHHYEGPDNFDRGPRDYEAFFRKTGAITRESDNPGMKIYVSEWNAQSTDWRTGLYCGGILNAFERCGDVVGMAAPALFLRHVSATEWDNAFINFDHTGWFPAPNYVVMKLWHDHYAPHRIALEGHVGQLNMVATRSEDGKTVYVKVVNPAKDAVALDVRLHAGFAPTEATLLMVAPGRLDARNTLDKPGAVHVEHGDATIASGRVQCTLPGLSAGVLTIR